MTRNRGRVLVVGSLNVDLAVEVQRHPKPGETVAGAELMVALGGKGANQAVAAARFGSPAILVAKAGDDAFAERLLLLLDREGVDHSQISRSAGHTGVAFVTVDPQAQNSIVLAQGANADLEPADLHGLSVGRDDVVVCQLEVPDPVVHAALARAKDAGARTVLNVAPARSCDPAILQLADVVVANQIEFEFLTAQPFDPGRYNQAAAALRARPSQSIVVTLGQHGSLLSTVEGESTISAHPVRARDTTGAGDCFVGVAAACLVERHPLDDALRSASRAASLCVQRRGAATSFPFRRELDEFAHAL